MYYSKKAQYLGSLQNENPDAVALLNGDEKHISIKGQVLFYSVNGGVLVVSEVFGLPKTDNKCKSNVFGFHIHEGTSCTGDMTDPFKDTMKHYNPDGCAHPYHAGDMPPLFDANGYAYMSFFTDRFNVSDVIGKAVIIHDKPDDFTSQPSGNSGNKIACGIIK